ncbi:MAG: phytanoyl-CoA dioxygenase [Gammaproteobacteria bacterium]|nr:phytanoyl-CoA dioxygenase [Gammaproteobacteria bacterium]
MRLSPDQVNAFHEEGYLFLPDYLPAALVEDMRAAVPEIAGRDYPGKVLEQDNATVRMIHGVHEDVPAFQALSHHPLLIEPIQAFLDSDVYIHQFKLNFKAAFDGEIWQWHQDFVYLNDSDGIPTPRMANAIIFLDEVNEFNGPLLLIPRSHQEGNVSSLTSEQPAAGYENGPDWLESMTTALKYTVTRDTVARLAAENGIVGPKGPPGSVLFFHPDCVHGSAPNMSPFGRQIIVINFNSTENLPVVPEHPRPGFLASRDYTPIVPEC